MSFTIVAIVVGLALGLLTGGRIRHLGDRRFRLWPLLVVGPALQIVAELDSADSIAFGLVAASYLCLLGFAAANVTTAGMGLVLIGLLMNAATILVNEGMPVEGKAIVAADLAEPHELATMEFGGKRHLMTGDDTLYWLSDVIPVRATGLVVSFGDLVMSVGIAAVLFNLLKPRRKPGEVPAYTQ